MKKTALIITILVLSLTVFVSGCASGSSTPSASPTLPASSSASPGVSQASSPSAEASPSPSAAVSSGEKIFTLADLSKYDGKNGNPAYVAVNGVVYDVTNVPQWSSGSHQGYTAGKDLTSAISNAPHGTDVLKDIPVVGKLQ